MNRCLGIGFTDDASNPQSFDCPRSALGSFLWHFKCEKWKLRTSLILPYQVFQTSLQLLAYTFTSFLLVPISVLSCGLDQRNPFRHYLMVHVLGWEPPLRLPQPH